MRALLVALVLLGSCGGDDDSTTFECGDQTCERGLEFCLATPDGQECRDMPGVCREDPDCACVANEVAADCTCVEDPADVLTATCPAS